MLHLPPTWPGWLVWTVFATTLAGLDLAMSWMGAMVIKTRGTDAMTGWFAGGAVAAVLLFWVIVSSLTYGDMIEMNVLWIAAVLALVPLVDALHRGSWPSLRVLLGLAGMIAFVLVIQWPGSDSAQAPPQEPAQPHAQTTLAAGRADPQPSADVRAIPHQRGRHVLPASGRRS